MVATLISGGNRSESDALVGLTVAQARARYAEAYNIPTDAVPLVNDERVSADYVIRADDELQFNKPSGEKGA